MNMEPLRSIGWMPPKNRKQAQSRAHAMVRNRILSGDIQRRPCERCGNQKAQAHHEDYSFPLELVWLCQLCHYARHREILDEALRQRIGR